MNRDKLLPAAIALASFVAGGALYWLLQPDLPQTVANSSTPLELHSIPLTDLDGAETRLADWQDELLVVNFWAPWCAPCRREIPALIEVRQQYAARGVRLLGLAFDNLEQVRRFAAEYRIDYPLFLAGNRSAMYNTAFDNPSGALPYTLLLDDQLRIVYQHHGELTAAELKAELEKRL